MIIALLVDTFEVFGLAACCLLDVMQPSIIGAEKSLKEISVRTGSPGKVARFGNRNIINE